MRSKHLIGWSPSLEPGLQTGHFFSENGRVLKLQRLHFAVTNRVELSDCRLLCEQKNSWDVKKPLGVDEPLRYYHKSWSCDLRNDCQTVHLSVRRVFPEWPSDCGGVRRLFQECQTVEVGMHCSCSLWPRLGHRHHPPPGPRDVWTVGRPRQSEA